MLTRLTRATIAAFGRTVTDGGWGTELMQRGGRPGECFEVWNLSHPDRVREVARAYVAAGSDIILTNSFGGNAITLARHGQAEQAQTINHAAATISREAAGDEVFVFGSIGPTGQLVSLGEVDENRLRDAFAEQARALEAGGADALVLETMTDLAEVEIALQVLRQEVSIPFGVSMTFDSGPDQLHTMMGVTIAALVEAAVDGGAAFVGANCGLGVEQYLRTAEAFGTDCPLPLWIKPNAGMPELTDGRVSYRTSAEQFAGLAPRFFAAGVRMLGGCCGTSPDFIRALKAQASRDG
jgi:5-methyltetrahydrofolate--homocysteine methyltransferase